MVIMCFNVMFKALWAACEGPDLHDHEWQNDIQYLHALYLEVQRIYMKEMF